VYRVWLMRYIPRVHQRYTAWFVVKVPVNGRSPAGELTCTDP
jgi:hypothetical protein